MSIALCLRKDILGRTDFPATALVSSLTVGNLVRPLPSPRLT